MNKNKQAAELLSKNINIGTVTGKPKELVKQLNELEKDKGEDFEVIDNLKELSKTKVDVVLLTLKVPLIAATGWKIELRLTQPTPHTYLIRRIEK